ncbi:MAG: porin [Myxococcales bacterium]
MEKRRQWILEALPRVVAGLALVMVTATAARAEVVAYSNDQWTISFDGRSNAYYSFEWGDSYPHWTAAQMASFMGNPPQVNSIIWNGFQNQSNQDPTMCMANGIANGQVCTFSTSRVHTGFVGNDFGFTVRKKISDTLKVTGRMSLWWPIETDQYRGWSSMYPDPRESYFKLEGRWGGLLAGRALGLHDRGGTSIDFLYANGHSVGNPCNATGQGPLCGFIGYGYQFPSFNAGFVYNTPLNGNGFQLSIGAYDPARIGHQTVLLQNTPYPRVESEATVAYKTDRLFFTLFVNGMWQRAGGFTPAATAGPDVLVARNALGASVGGRLEFGGLKVGAVANYDKGGGELVGLADSIPVDNNGNLRTVTGAFGVAMYSLGLLDLSIGAGLTHVQQTDFDISHHDDVIKDRLGTAGTVVYHIDPSITWSLQYFRAQHTFWLGQIQNLNFVTTGMDFIW